MLFSNIDYDDYVGRIGIGRVERGSIQVGQTVTICGGAEDTRQNARITKLYQFEGLKRVEHDSAQLGDIIAVSGIAELNMRPNRLRHRLRGAFALCEDRRAHRVHEFHGEQLPLCWAGGQVRHLPEPADRLFKEVETNVAMRWRRRIPPIPTRSRAGASCTFPSSLSRCAARGMNFR